MRQTILKTARERVFKTQEQVANETGIGVRNYQLYETNGRGSQTIRNAIRIAQSLDSTVEELWPVDYSVQGKFNTPNEKNQAEK